MEVFARREFNGLMRPRVFRLTIVAVFFFVLLSFRLWMLQVVHGDHYSNLAENNRVRLIRVPSSRGIIYDRKGEVLVTSQPSFDLSLIPEDSPDMDRAILNLAGQIGIPPAEIEGKVAESKGIPPYGGIIVRRDLGWEEVARIEARQIELPGVHLFVFPRRSYPYGSIAAHMIGYTGEVTQSGLRRLKGEDYRMGDEVGLFGIEKSWEAFLRGEPGGQQIEVDALGRRLRVLHEVPEVPGYNLVLTVDRDLQLKAEEKLAGKEGAIVVLDVNDGSLLAMASSPSFDPNHFARGLSSGEWEKLRGNRLNPMTNRAVQGQYPPGSTFKIIMAAAALEEGVIDPTTKFYDSGGLAFGNRVFRCWKPGGHGWVDLHKAIVQSCDVYFYHVGQRLGVDRIARYARAFGLNQKTGIALDHEKAGLVPDSGWKKSQFRQPWFPGETLSVAIGQGYLVVTPIQMAVMMAAVANGGTLYRPWYVRRVETHDGIEIRRYQPEVLGGLPIQKSTLEILHRALGDVVESGVGTGGAARVEGVRVAGKTGTAQVIQGRGQSYQTRDHAWFVAFAPLEKPEVALAVVVEHGGHGGTAAAPVAREILKEYFRVRGVRVAH